MTRAAVFRATLAVLVALVTIGSSFALSTGGVAARTGAAGPVPAERPGAPVNPGAASPSPDVSTLSTAAQRMLSVTQSLRANGVPAGAIHLPDLAAESVNHHAPVTPTYAQAPAPMGVADIGIHNVSGVLRGYTMYTQSAMGQITLNNARSVYVDGDGADMFGIQFNTVLDNVTIAGNSTYQFWTQNFVSYTPSSGWLVFGDNVWNFSSLSGNFPSSSLFSYGPNGTLADSLVYFAPGPSFTVHYPFTLTFYNNASLVGGRSAVFFNYTVSNATSSRSGSFDQVVFNSNLTRLGGPAKVPAFQVDGQRYDPIGLVNDLELDVVGNDDGDTTVFTAMNATLSIASWDTTSASFVPVPSAYNEGSDTGETSSGLAVFWNGSSPVAEMRTGPSFLLGLWNVSGGSGVRLLHLTLTPANAFVFVTAGSAFNASASQWAPAASSPYDLYLPNVGTFDLLAELSDFSPTNQTVSPAANSTTNLVITLSANPALGIYTPLYAWSNAELGALSTSGTGTLANPFVLERSQFGSLNPEFAQWNDFQFPVFAGVQLVDTSAAVTITPASFAITYPTWMLPELAAFGQPTTNNLQLLFFNVSNVTVRGAPGITGWLSVFVSGFPEAAVIFWNSSHDLVAGNTFNDEGGALAYYGGTANTVWGNWFLPATPNATNPSYLFDSGGNTTAVNLSESGDLLYNNAFVTPIDAVTPTEDALSCQVACEPATYSDTWNISYEPASAGSIVNGVNLTGSIVGTTYQGGNYWWNYGTLSDPYDAIPYNDSGLINVGGDYLPLTFAVMYEVTFRETGLAPGTPWSLTAEGVKFSSSNSTLLLQSPDGTYPYTVAPVTGYTVPTPKSFTVAGANVTVSLTFRLDYPVSFTANYLPAGQTWTVTVESSTHLVSSASGSGTARLTLPLFNGSYNFTVGAIAGYTSTPSQGVFSVAGAPVAESITFLANVNATYPVEFAESGLATGTLWSVALGSQAWTSTNATLTVPETNGTYSFHLSEVAGYDSSLVNPVVVTVQGAAATVDVTFTAIHVTNTTYSVTFSESGLLSGTNWSVNVSGTVGHSLTSSIVLSLPDGLYTVNLAAHPPSAAESYLVHPASLTFAVSGAAPPVQTVVFTPIGSVVVQATGLSASTPWVWVVQGANASLTVSDNGTVALPDGSYTYAASATGYAATPASGEFSVSGFGVTFVNLSFAPVTTTSPSSGSTTTSLTPYYLAIAILAVLAVFLFIGAMEYRRRSNVKPPPPPAPYTGLPPAEPAGNTVSPPPPPPT
jgi:thermopsin